MNNAHFKQFAQESEPSIELKHGNSPTSSPSSEEASTSSGNDGLLQMEEGDGGDTGAAVLLKAHGLGKFALPLNELGVNTVEELRLFCDRGLGDAVGLKKAHLVKIERALEGRQAPDQRASFGPRVLKMADPHREKGAPLASTATPSSSSSSASSSSSSSRKKTKKSTKSKATPPAVAQPVTQQQEQPQQHRVVLAATSFDGSDYAVDFSQSVLHLPLPYKMAFRFKLLGLLAVTNVAIVVISIIAAATLGAQAEGKFQLSFNITASVLCPLMMAVSTLIVINNYIRCLGIVVLTTHKEKPYPVNFASLAFFAFTTGVFFGTTSPTWPNNVNWQIVGYTASISFLFWLLATASHPLVCLAAENQPTSPAVLFDCNACADCVGCGDNLDSLSTKADDLRLSGHKHLEGGRRPVFSLIAAGLTAWTINLVASIILLNLTHFCGTDEFVFLHFLFFLLSWIMAYLVQLIEEGVGVDGYMQGVVSFWSNMVTGICCCACVCAGMDIGLEVGLDPANATTLIGAREPVSHGPSDPPPTGSSSNA